MSQNARKPIQRDEIKIEIESTIQRPSASKPIRIQPVHLMPEQKPITLYSPFGARVGATCLDGCILLGIYWLLAKQFGPIDWVQQFIIYFVYKTAFQGSPLRATPGKYLQGLEVLTDSHRPLTLIHSAGRSLAELLSMATVYLGYLLSLFRQDRRALHDLCAKTVVLSKRDYSILLTIIGIFLLFGISTKFDSEIISALLKHPTDIPNIELKAPHH